MYTLVKSVIKLQHKLTADVESALLITRSATTVMSSGIPPPHMMSFSLARRAKGESRVLSRDSSRALRSVRFGDRYVCRSAAHYVDRRGSEGEVHM